MIASKTTHYVRDRKVYTRCSRCRTEFQRQPEPRIVGANGERIVEPEPLGMLTLGQELLGLVCAGCYRAVCMHLLAIWPESEPFVYVDPKTNELVNTRCNGCGTSRGSCEAGFDELGRGAKCCPDCDHFSREPRALLPDEHGPVEQFNG